MKTLILSTLSVLVVLTGCADKKKNSKGQNVSTECVAPAGFSDGAPALVEDLVTGAEGTYKLTEVSYLTKKTYNKTGLSSSYTGRTLVSKNAKPSETFTTEQSDTCVDMTKTPNQRIIIVTNVPFAISRKDGAIVDKNFLHIDITSDGPLYGSQNNASRGKTNRTYSTATIDDLDTLVKFKDRLSTLEPVKFLRIDETHFVILVADEQADRFEDSKTKTTTRAVYELVP